MADKVDRCLSFYICNPNHEFTACPWKLLQQQIGPKELARPKIVQNTLLKSMRARERYPAQNRVTRVPPWIQASYRGLRARLPHLCPSQIPRLAVGDQCSGCRAEVEVLVVPSCQNSLERQNMSLCYSL